jgi:DDE superfamily endonuclease
VPVDPRYQWGYVFGALQVAGGGAEFFYCPTVSLDCSRLFLEQIAARDPAAVHAVIWDGAGFHQGEGSQDLPENIRILSLPAYSPELNPVEKLWDIVKDRICNRLFADLSELETTITCVLKDYWLDARRVLDLVGRNWLLAQANASSASIILM